MITSRLLFLITSLAGYILADSTACVVVEGDRIVAGDLASRLPAFRRVSSDAPLGFAPAPGALRVFKPFELVSLAKRYGVEADPSDEVCFERRLEPLDRTKILDAMREALPDARIEIVETSLFKAPPGKLSFRLEGLRRPLSPQAPAEWHGDVICGENRHFAVWARVIVSVRSTRVVAVESLKTGGRITPDQVRVETVDGFPAGAGVAHSFDEIDGRIPWRPIAKGSEIQLAWLRLPADINRGDTVDVEVRSGAARLAFPAVADASGRTGDLITLRNPSSGKHFKARINGRGRALVDADPAVN